VESVCAGFAFIGPFFYPGFLGIFPSLAFNEKNMISDKKNSQKDRVATNGK